MCYKFTETKLIKQFQLIYSTIEEFFFCFRERGGDREKDLCVFVWHECMLKMLETVLDMGLTA